MKIVIFGATGMVGQGALRESLRDPGVQSVLSIVRTASGRQQQKLREITHQDFLDFTSLENELQGLDACLFCLGVSFVYVSGAGTDSTERGRVMWARVKGKTENALLAMPFRAAYMFRPGLIQPLDGITSKTASYRILYKLTSPLLTLARRFWPQYVTTTEELGLAMLAAAERGTEKRIVEAQQIRGLLQSLS